MLAVLYVQQLRINIQFLNKMTDYFFAISRRLHNIIKRKGVTFNI